ncbi:unnamed protein product [Ixodes pacificus]
MTEEHSSSGDPTVASDAHSLRKAIAEMKAEISKKRELLRKLHMVKTHRIKNSENSIEDLISQWRLAAQDALTDLQKQMPEPKPSLKNMLANLNIEHSLVGYNEEDDCFA